MMSPLIVAALTDAVLVLSAGVGDSETGRSDLVDPESEDRSRYTFDPGAIPTSMSPDTACKLTFPPIRFATLTSPETVVTFAWLSTRPTATSPDAVRATSLPATLSARTSPDALWKVSVPPTLLTERSPLATFANASPVTSCKVASPDAQLKSTDSDGAVDGEVRGATFDRPTSSVGEPSV